MKRRGQVSIFIILGFLLIIMFSLIYFLSPREIPLPNTQEGMAVKTFIDSCIDSVGKDAVYFVAMQGGYYSVPEPKNQYSILDIPAYWNLGQANIPDKSIVENELIKYVQASLPVCIDDFNAFDEQGYEFEIGEISGNTKVLADKVEFNINYPVKIKRGSTTTQLDRFSRSIELDFNSAFDFARKIIERQALTPNEMPIGFITDLSYNNNFTFELISVDQNNQIISLIFNEPDGDPLIFAFSSRYDWANPTYVPEEKPVIEPIPAITINNTGMFQYQVKADGNNLSFYDNTNLFDINKQTGLIRFDSTYLDNGEYFIFIKAVDAKENENSVLMRIVINKPGLLPIINEIPDQIAYVDQEFRYKINAIDPSNSFLMLSDDTLLFDIHPQTGEIRFTPDIPLNETIKITVVNKAGYAFSFMRLEVK